MIIHICFGVLNILIYSYTISYAVYFYTLPSTKSSSVTLSKYSSIWSSNFFHNGNVIHSVALSHFSAPSSRQPTGANVPSVSYCAGVFSSLYPPALPRWLFTICPLCNNDTIISKYFMEIPCLSATSFSDTKDSPSFWAKSIITLKAYLPFVEIIISKYLSVVNTLLLVYINATIKST